ncbi:MAG: hypothetical protein ACRDDZ_02030 [Marinifilaceae bacterium]
MERLKQMFKVVRDDLRENVPPLTEEINQEHHFEVWAENNGKKTFFAKVILHETMIELAFYPKLTYELEWELFPDDIFKRMQGTFDVGIMDLTPELRANIKEVIANLIQYFQEKKLLPA